MFHKKLTFTVIVTFFSNKGRWVKTVKEKKNEDNVYVVQITVLIVLK